MPASDRISHLPYSVLCILTAAVVTCEVPAHVTSSLWVPPHLIESGFDMAMHAVHHDHAGQDDMCDVMVCLSFNGFVSSPYSSKGKTSPS